MRAWLIVLTVLVVAVMLGLVGLAAGVAVLHPGEQRATRARAVLPTPLGADPGRPSA